jgi:uncharacterized protein DUF4062
VSPVGLHVRLKPTRQALGDSDMSSAPAVLVSSTFYDLRQIRADLARFIADELGYVPLLSELSSFPVDPDLDTVANCRARVEKDADIFVLVIGGRYGSIDDKTDRSITNLEFLAARQKGIPVYAFVEKSVSAVVPTWRANPSADFSATVDTPRLFDFIEYVRSRERVWTFSFETAQDITSVLRRQLAYLFHDALRIRLRLSGNELPSYFASLGPKALRLALERPKAWEYRLLLQSWIEEVERRKDQIKEYQSGLTLDASEFVSAVNAFDWVRTRLHELSGLVESANRLISSSAQEAFGKRGEPGNPEDLVWVSRMFGAVLDGLLRWARRTRCMRLEPPFEGMGTQLALFVDDLIRQFETFPGDALRKIEEALTLTSSGVSQGIEVTIVFRLSNLDGFEQELESVRRRSAL